MDPAQMTPPADGTDAPAPPDSDMAPKVVATILDNGDGTYQLVKGEYGAEPMEGAAPGGEDAAPAGETFDSIGAVLKGVMDCLKENDGTGEGKAQASFNEGFNGFGQTGDSGSEPNPPNP
jgi:hypothetical protein